MDIQEKRNIWKSLLINLAIANIIMVVIWTIQTAFEQQPYYSMSFVITNVVSVILWGLRTFSDSW
ncbi:MAG: hypothetical protein mread185_000195 [Mycoplasmataceae bacterium]|nr:MAG: hypothetical protein mread185_000195 [Mycoplasmataceae bacterium]